MQLLKTFKTKSKVEYLFEEKDNINSIVMSTRRLQKERKEYFSYGEGVNFLIDIDFSLSFCYETIKIEEADGSGSNCLNSTSAKKLLEYINSGDVQVKLKREKDLIFQGYFKFSKQGDSVSLEPITLAEFEEINSRY